MRTFSVLSETFVYDTIRELERQGDECEVLALRRENAAERPHGRVEIAGMPPKWHPRRVYCRAVASIRGTRHGRRAYWPLYRRPILEHIRESRPDVIHAHFGIPAVIVAPVAAAVRTPLVATFYGNDISEESGHPAIRTEYERLWQRAAAVTVLSEEMHAQAVALGCPAAKLHVVHLGRDLRGVTPRPPRSAVRSFLSVGRLTEKKGHLDTVRAIEAVHASGHPVRLRIIGEGPLRVELAKYIRSRGIEYVELLGPLPSDRVIREMEAADAFILSSRTARSGDREGTPTVLIEAQALGLPCISTRHAGIPEVIPPENHFLLAEEGNVKEIAERIRRLLACTPAELARIAARGRDKVATDFDLARETAKLKSVYDAVLRARSISEA